MKFVSNVEKIKSGGKACFVYCLITTLLDLDKIRTGMKFDKIIRENILTNCENFQIGQDFNISWYNGRL